MENPKNDNNNSQNRPNPAPDLNGNAIKTSKRLHNGVVAIRDSIVAPNGRLFYLCRFCNKLFPVKKDRAAHIKTCSAKAYILSVGEELPKEVQEPNIPVKIETSIVKPSLGAAEKFEVIATPVKCDVKKRSRRKEIWNEIGPQSVKRPWDQKLPEDITENLSLQEEITIELPLRGDVVHKLMGKNRWNESGKIKNLSQSLDLPPVTSKLSDREVVVDITQSSKEIVIEMPIKDCSDEEWDETPTKIGKRRRLWNKELTIEVPFPPQLSDKEIWDELIPRNEKKSMKTIEKAATGTAAQCDDPSNSGQETWNSTKFLKLPLKNDSKTKLLGKESLNVVVVESGNLRDDTKNVLGIADTKNSPKSFCKVRNEILSKTPEQESLNEVCRKTAPERKTFINLPPKNDIISEISSPLKMGTNTRCSGREKTVEAKLQPEITLEILCGEAPLKIAPQKNSLIPPKFAPTKLASSDIVSEVTAIEAPLKMAPKRRTMLDPELGFRTKSLELTNRMVFKGENPKKFDWEEISNGTALKTAPRRRTLLDPKLGFRTKSLEMTNEVTLKKNEPICHKTPLKVAPKETLLEPKFSEVNSKSEDMKKMENETILEEAPLKIDPKISIFSDPKYSEITKEGSCGDTKKIESAAILDKTPLKRTLRRRTLLTSKTQSLDADGSKKKRFETDLKEMTLKTDPSNRILLDPKCSEIINKVTSKFEDIKKIESEVTLSETSLKRTLRRQTLLDPKTLEIINETKPEDPKKIGTTLKESPLRVTPRESTLLDPKSVDATKPKETKKTGSESTLKESSLRVTLRKRTLLDPQLVSTNEASSKPEETEKSGSESTLKESPLRVTPRKRTLLDPKSVSTNEASSKPEETEKFGSESTLKESPLRVTPRKRTLLDPKSVSMDEASSKPEKTEKSGSESILKESPLRVTSRKRTLLDPKLVSTNEASSKSEETEETGSESTLKELSLRVTSRKRTLLDPKSVSTNEASSKPEETEKTGSESILKESPLRVTPRKRTLLDPKLVSKDEASSKPEETEKAGSESILKESPLRVTSRKRTLLDPKLVSMNEASSKSEETEETGSESTLKELSLRVTSRKRTLLDPKSVSTNEASSKPEETEKTGSESILKELPLRVTPRKRTLLDPKLVSKNEASSKPEETEKSGSESTLKESPLRVTPRKRTLLDPKSVSTNEAPSKPEETEKTGSESTLKEPPLRVTPRRKTWLNPKLVSVNEPSSKLEDTQKNGSETTLREAPLRVTSRRRTLLNPKLDVMKESLEIPSKVSSELGDMKKNENDRPLKVIPRRKILLNPKMVSKTTPETGVTIKNGSEDILNIETIKLNPRRRSPKVAPRRKSPNMSSSEDVNIKDPEVEVETVEQISNKPPLKGAHNQTPKLASQSESLQIASEIIEEILPKTVPRKRTLHTLKLAPRTSNLQVTETSSNETSPMDPKFDPSNTKEEIIVTENTCYVAPRTRMSSKSAPNYEISTKPTSDAIVVPSQSVPRRTLRTDSAGSGVLEETSKVPPNNEEILTETSPKLARISKKNLRVTPKISRSGMFPKLVSEISEIAKGSRQEVEDEDIRQIAPEVRTTETAPNDVFTFTEETNIETAPRRNSKSRKVRNQINIKVKGQSRRVVDKMLFKKKLPLRILRSRGAPKVNIKTKSISSDKGEKFAKTISTKLTQNGTPLETNVEPKTSDEALSELTTENETNLEPKIFDKIHLWSDVTTENSVNSVDDAEVPKVCNETESLIESLLRAQVERVMKKRSFKRKSEKSKRDSVSSPKKRKSKLTIEDRSTKNNNLTPTNEQNSILGRVPESKFHPEAKFEKKIERSPRRRSKIPLKSNQSNELKIDPQPRLSIDRIPELHPETEQQNFETAPNFDFKQTQSSESRVEVDPKLDQINHSTPKIIVKSTPKINIKQNIILNEQINLAEILPKNTPPIKLTFRRSPSKDIGGESCFIIKNKPNDETPKEVVQESIVEDKTTKVLKETQNWSDEEMKQDEENEEETLEDRTCRECPNPTVFKTAMEMLLHVREMHKFPKVVMAMSEIKKFYGMTDWSKCPICDKPLKKVFRSAFRRHLNTHANELGHVCTVCNKKFRRADHMKEHAKRHVVEKK